MTNPFIESLISLKFSIKNLTESKSLKSLLAFLEIFFFDIFLKPLFRSCSFIELESILEADKEEEIIPDNAGKLILSHSTNAEEPLLNTLSLENAGFESMVSNKPGFKL